MPQGWPAAWDNVMKVRIDLWSPGNRRVNMDSCGGETADYNKKQGSTTICMNHTGGIISQLIARIKYYGHLGTSIEAIVELPVLLKATTPKLSNNAPPVP